LIRDWSQVK